MSFFHENIKKDVHVKTNSNHCLAINEKKNFTEILQTIYIF